MLLQNTLDLSTFEIVRFRIWNQTSNPNDYGIGTKYFNTNSGHEGYNRENIYTATGWRKTAYMDDIEAITNGEGSLGTRVKALEGMLNVDSAETVVSTWAEIQAFLDQVQEGTDLMDLLNSKFDKAGGEIVGTTTITSNNNFPLILRRNQEGITQVGAAFVLNEVQVGVLACNSTGEFLVRNNSLPNSSYNKLLHTGNVGDYALKIDGSNAMTGDLQLLVKNSGAVNVEASEGLFIYRGPSSGGTDVGLPDNYINFLNVGGANVDTNLQLAWLRASDKLALHARVGKTGTYSDWKTLAFTDSDITGNADTATKLKTAVSLWGNSFDGTQSLSGNITIGNQGTVSFAIADGTSVVDAIQVNSLDNLLIGQGVAKNSGNTLVYGNNIKFCYGTAGSSTQTAMTITEEGNVLIGNPDTVNSAKFLVNGGTAHIHGIGSLASLGEVLDLGLTIGSAAYGISQWVTGSGQGNIQVGRFDGTATAYALNLNPLGGAVNIGSANGAINVLGNLTTSGDITLGKANVANKIQSEGPIQILANSRYLYLQAKGGIDIVSGGYGQDSYGITFANAALAPFAANNNTISLGTSSYRWSNVYSIGGNFSGRVLIGGAADDGESALQVNNTMSIGASKTSLGLRFNRSSFTAWIPDDHPYSHSVPFQLKKGDAVLGAFGHYITNGEYIAYIGANFGNPWFTINSEASDFNILTNFNGGALIPTGQTLTIGSVTFKEVATGEIEVDGNLHTTGTLASGGKADEGTGSTGGASGTIREFTIDPPTDNTSSFKLEHSFNTEKVIVQIFELNGNSGKYEMILTDVEITDANNVTVTFGRKPTEYHKVYVMA